MAHSDWNFRDCPSCGSRSKPVLEISSKQPAEDLSFEEVRDFFVGLRKNQVFFSYFRCVDCNLLFCPYYFSKTQLEILYAEMPDNLMGEDKGTASKTQGGYVRWIIKKVKAVDSFLEIGPDVGLVCSKIVTHFRPKRVSLVEPNVAIYEQLKSSVSNVSELELVRDLKEVKSNSHNLIVGVHVLDHLLNPREDLGLLAELSTSSSKLVFVVHNEKSYLRRFLKGKWPPFCLQHPQIFNPETLKILLISSGWSLDNYSRTTNWWHLRNLIGTGLNIFGLPSGISRALPNVEIPTKLGNIIGMASPSNFSKLR